MKIGFVGLPQAGKSSIFRLLTGQPKPAESFQAKAAVGVARVPDRRLDVLTRMFQPKKTVPATVDLVDIIGISKGASESTVSAQFLTQIRPMDALLHVVRRFESDLLEPALPVRQAIRAVEDELLLADLGVVEKRMERLEKDVLKLGRKEEKVELDLIRRCKEALEAETPLRALGLGTDEQRLLRGYGLFTLKPELLVINVDEATVSDKAAGARLQEEAGGRGIVLSAALEEEIAALAESEREAFLREYGLEEPARDRLLRACYETLGYISFFTVGPDECRAWPIPRGTNAQSAAGVIHSDLERGFIRAETIGYEELVEAGGLNEAKRVGKLRLEGKEYEVLDGDVLNIRFNV
jgi:ribosome-binding ATPase